MIRQFIQFADFQIIHQLNDWVFSDRFLELIVLICARYLIIVFIAVGVYLWFRKSPNEKGGFWKVSGRENRQAVIMALLALAAGFLLDIIISTVFPRQRPFVTYPELHRLSLTLDFTSFPSRHAMAVFALATSIWMADLWHFRKWGIFLFIVAFFISVARVAAGVHYPSDVAAGIIIGVASAWIIHENYDWIKKHIFRDFVKR